MSENLRKVKDGIEAIKNGLQKRNADIEELKSRVDNFDEALLRSAASQNTTLVFRFPVVGSTVESLNLPGLCC